MRQFFSWRIWGAFVALALLAVGLKFVLPASASTSSAPIGPTPRTVQFVSLVYAAKPSNTFAMDKGLVSGSIDFILDGQRTMHVYAGTPGDITCPDLNGIAKCVVLADLLGDAVVWFALVPVHDGLKVELPPIVALLPDGIAQLSNGWHVPHASIIDRSCPQETTSLTEFMRNFGPESTTIVDVAKQEITQVKCSPKVTAGTTA